MDRWNGDSGLGDNARNHGKRIESRTYVPSMSPTQSDPNPWILVLSGLLSRLALFQVCGGQMSSKITLGHVFKWFLQ